MCSLPVSALFYESVLPCFSGKYLFYCLFSYQSRFIAVCFFHSSSTDICDVKEGLVCYSKCKIPDSHSKALTCRFSYVIKFTPVCIYFDVFTLK